ncbi:MAG TPA: class B sortase [Candidatus Eisenbergiella merdavium]|uniref:Class B sortase n=1 Tax=Candidatus Eisenbergiella merdavium TaxID=2838551 RepID=A0A9D2SQX9_9FIRM|nr:class B sortase [Candidatus Eisenbergiella merdavium]
MIKNRNRSTHGKRYGLMTAAALLALLLTACGNAKGAPAQTGQETSSTAEGQVQTAKDEAADATQESASLSASAPEAGARETEGTLLTDETIAEEAGEEGTETTGKMENSLEAWLDEDGTLNLVGLQEINEDIYAWLDIPGTRISFPLLQSLEDEYFYLSHNESKEADDGGCIYTEYFNRRDFSDPNTVIYGRNADGRFALLHQYQDRDFFDANRTVNIYLEDRTLRYEIFAAYNYDDRHLIKIYDFWDKDIFSSYLETVFSQRAMDAYVDDSVQVTADDRIITLSTGVTGQDDRRYLVQAVQVSG